MRCGPLLAGRPPPYRPQCRSAPKLRATQPAAFHGGVMNDKSHSQGALNIVAGITVAVAFLMVAAAGLFYWDADTQVDNAIEAAAAKSRPAEMAAVRASADASADRLVNALSGTTAGEISVTSDHATGSLSAIRADIGGDLMPEVPANRPPTEKVVVLPRRARRPPRHRRSRAPIEVARSRAGPVRLPPRELPAGARPRAGPRRRAERSREPGRPAHRDQRQVCPGCRCPDTGGHRPGRRHPVRAREGRATAARRAQGCRARGQRIEARRLPHEPHARRRRARIISPTKSGCRRQPCAASSCTSTPAPARSSTRSAASTA